MRILIFVTAASATLFGPHLHGPFKYLWTPSLQYVCQQLKAKITPENVFCDLDKYGRLDFVDFNGDVTKGWNFGNENCNEKAVAMLVVVRPANAFEITEVVKFAGSAGIPLSVRSGGHSYTCNSVKKSSIHLDMRSLDSVEIIPNTFDDSPPNDELRVAKFGAGNNFKQIFKTIDVATYSFVHGECHTVGVGGFYLHGGAHAGILSEKYGYGNESIRELEMVIADGSILNFQEKRTKKDTQGYLDYLREPVRVTKDGVPVTDKAYADLWDAMRVAGSSFGIVTSLTIQLYEASEPHVFFFVIDLSEEDQLQLFDDAAQDDGMNLNLYHYHGYMNILNVEYAIIQMSVTDGSNIKREAKEQCLKWLDVWMEKKPRQYLLWRWFKLKNLLTWGINLFLDLNQQDYKIVYPTTKDWVTSSVLIKWSESDRKSIMQWYKRKYSKAKERKPCWLIFAQLDNRAYIEDRALYVDLTCGAEHKGIIQEIELEFPKVFPNISYSKYYNVPIEFNTKAEESSLKHLYFPEYDKLHVTKLLFDPNGLFDQHQGIRVHDEF